VIRVGQEITSSAAWESEQVAVPSPNRKSPDGLSHQLNGWLFLRKARWEAKPTLRPEGKSEAADTSPLNSSRTSLEAFLHPTLFPSCIWLQILGLLD